MPVLNEGDVNHLGDRHGNPGADRLMDLVQTG